MKNLTKLSVVFFALTALLFSCSKEKTDQNDESNFKFQSQRVFVNGHEYNLTAKIEKKGDYLEYLNEPAELTTFFNEYDETLVTYIIVKDGKETIIYYKNQDEFNANVKFEDMPQSRLKGQNQARMDCWPHIENYTGYKLSGENWQYKSFNFNNNWGWGNSSSYVGDQINDEISQINLQKIGYQASIPINLMACQHANWGGKKFYLTNYDGSGYKYMTDISFGCCNRTWNDRISSIEFWDSPVSVNGITI